ncbi:hypothetical protein BDQ17DRAFT_1420098 [Cyathus striatus]|nr:hypothetical protein BDQ17DRAFT_1420098 [Cyathus striatus]
MTFRQSLQHQTTCLHTVQKHQCGDTSTESSNAISFHGKSQMGDLLPPPNLKAHASVRILGLGLDNDGVKDLFKDFDVVNINISEPAKESYAFVEFDSVNTALEAQEILRVQLVRHAFAKQKD